ncbi:MAG: hypothetical protein JWL99_5501 [Streptomyces oryziradicis]|jgi:hypothetical protein|nr:hypothetical protein [Actinacidiphila oryziradicis]
MAAGASSGARGGNAHPYISSPGRKCFVRPPTASTTPQRSSPNVNGGSQNLRAIPERIFQSAGFTPTARARTSTSPGPGAGRSTSTISRTSAPS